MKTIRQIASATSRDQQFTDHAIGRPSGTHLVDGASQVASRLDQGLERTEKLLAEQLASEGCGRASEGCGGRGAGQSETVELTVVIPVYNEPVTVFEIVERVQALPISKQIIVVDDGSTDDTSWRLKRLRGMPGIVLLRHAVNRGKGAALQTGFEHACGQLVIVQDADLEYDPQDILKVIQPLQAGDCDVVYGSRYLENAEQDPSRIHRLGNWALTMFSNLLTGQRLTDMETCYKAFRREILSEIEIEQSRFGFEPEITAKLAHRGVGIREVGISYSCRSRQEGKKIGWRDLVNAVWCIVRYRFVGGR